MKNKIKLPLSYQHDITSRKFPKILVIPVVSSSGVQELLKGLCLMAVFKNGSLHSISAHCDQPNVGAETDSQDGSLQISSHSTGIT